MPEQPSLFDHLDDPNDDRHVADAPGVTPILLRSGAPDHDTQIDPMQPDTDLHLSLRGRRGNHDDAAAEALSVLRAAGIGPAEVVERLTDAVPAPQLDDVSERAVRQWIDTASYRIMDYQTSWRLRRAVLDLLDAQFHSQHHARRHAERVQAQADDHAAKQAGTYWRDRDSRRRANRAVHVDVDPDAWNAFKSGAIRQGTTVGEAVGELVDVAVRRRGVDLARAATDETNRGRRGGPGEERRAREFSRIAVDDDTWCRLRAQATEHHLTVARAVGVLVELAACRLAGPSLGSG